MEVACRTSLVLLFASSGAAVVAGHEAVELLAGGDLDGLRVGKVIGGIGDLVRGLAGGRSGEGDGESRDDLERGVHDEDGKVWAVDV